MVLPARAISFAQAMKVLQGASVVESEQDLLNVLACAPRVVIDVGAGDGRWAYERARRDAGTLYLGLDPDAEAMKMYAYRASRKPARGGVANAVFAVGSVEEPPDDLVGIADEVRVNFPWAALLRGLLSADARVLSGLASLGKPGATFGLVLTYDAGHDHGAGLGEAAASVSCRLARSAEGAVRPRGAADGGRAPPEPRRSAGDTIDLGPPAAARQAARGVRGHVRESGRVSRAGRWAQRSIVTTCTIRWTHCGDLHTIDRR